MEQFHKGITAVGRDFVKLQRVYLPERALYEVVEFYYNVWKLKQLPVSRGWALREAEVRAVVVCDVDTRCRVQIKATRAEESPLASDASTSDSEGGDDEKNDRTVKPRLRKKEGEQQQGEVHSK